MGHSTDERRWAWEALQEKIPMAIDPPFRNPSNHPFVPSIYCKQCSKLAAGHLPTPVEQRLDGPHYETPQERTRPMAQEFTAAEDVCSSALYYANLIEGEFPSAARMLRLLAEKLREPSALADDAKLFAACDAWLREFSEASDKGLSADDVNVAACSVFRAVLKAAPDAGTGGRCPVHPDLGVPCRICGEPRSVPVDAGTGEALDTRHMARDEKAQVAEALSVLTAPLAPLDLAAELTQRAEMAEAYRDRLSREVLAYMQRSAESAQRIEQAESRARSAERLAGNARILQREAESRLAEVAQAARALRRDANRLCDRMLGGTYEADMRRTIAEADAVLSRLPATGEGPAK